MLNDGSNEVGKDSPQPSMFSPGSTAEPEGQVSASVAMPTPLVTTIPPPSPYYPAVSPMPDSAADARYTSNPFRTPRIPSSTFGHALRSSPSSKSTPNLK